MATLRQEFDYPSGQQNQYSTYQGLGGCPVGSFLIQAAAAVALGEPNIILTRYFNDRIRIMIHRNVRPRLAHLAGFLHWDGDPYW